MRNVPSILAAAGLFLILLLYMCSFQVRSTEVAIRKTFGKADADVIEEARLYAKWPWPVQSVVKYDKRLRVLVDKTEETRTSDSKNIILTTYTVWTVADPYKFHVSYPNEAEGEKALRTKIRAHKMAVAGKHAFSEFVSTDPAERRTSQIEKEMMELVSAEARHEFGVDVKLFGIKQLALPEEVTKAVFESMRKAEENKADNLKAEGDAVAAEIVAQASAQQQRILAVTRRKVDAIKNDAQRQVGEIYEAFAANPGLRIFLDKLRSLEEVFREHTTFLLDMETAPIDVFDDARRLDAIRGQAGEAIPEAEQARLPVEEP